MSLNWDVSKIAAQDVCWKKCETSDPGAGKKAGETYLDVVTEAIIWGSMAVDLGSITKENVDEWCFRYAVLSKLGTFQLSKFEAEGEKIVRWNPTREDIEMHVGLGTNVSNRTRKQFMQKMADSLQSDVERDERYAKQDAAKKAESVFKTVVS